MKTLFFQESFLLFCCLVFAGLFATVLFPKSLIKILSLLILIILFCMYFYREEERAFHRTENLLAVCDGKVIDIIHDPEKHTFKIVVFLNIFDQHQQYYPVDGVVVGTTYKKGTFHPAYVLKKSKLNERMTTTMRCRKNNSIVSITQIAGQIARRIVNDARKGEKVRQGEWLGMIKFSSRVDIEFSSGVYVPSVEIGQKIIAKKTILASIKK